MSEPIRVPVQITALEQVSGVFIQRSMQAHFFLNPDLARQIVALAQTAESRPSMFHTQGEPVPSMWLVNELARRIAALEDESDIPTQHQRVPVDEQLITDEERQRIIAKVHEASDRMAIATDAECERLRAWVKRLKDLMDEVLTVVVEHIHSNVPENERERARFIFKRINEALKDTP